MKILYAKPNQVIEVVRYNREFVIAVIVITEFDCICKIVYLLSPEKVMNLSYKNNQSGALKMF